MKENIFRLSEELLERKDFRALKQLLAGIAPHTLARLIEGADETDAPLIFRILPKETAAETFVELDADTREQLIRTFSQEYLREIIGELFDDDVADIVEEMPANAVKRILAAADPRTRSAVNELLKYPPDSAGSIMTTEYVSLRESMTVEEAFAHIRQVGVDKETVYNCYVTAPDKKLTGIVTVRTLLLAGTGDTIGALMERNVISVRTDADREEVAQEMGRYDFLAMPVTDNEHRLVGIVTFDDAIDVLREETTEDIEKMAAITPTDRPYLKTSVFQHWSKRIPWLLLLMISATFTGSIISYFEDSLSKMVILTAFIPMLMDTGGNAGSQSSVTVVRGLSVGDISIGDFLRIIWKEFRIAVLCGITLAAVGFAKFIFIDRVTLAVALTVSFTLFITVIFAKIAGAALPVLAKRTGFDPAVMASPFITTIVDALSLLVFFNIAKLMLPQLG